MQRWLREPLVHFLGIGLLLFVAFQWSGRTTGAGSRRIVITSGQMDAITAGFMRTWMRSPTEAELKAQIDEYAREEIATREAIAMGLDRDDSVIRRRLRQKFEFVVEDGIEAAPPTDPMLQQWLDAHAQAYRVEPIVSFRQVTFSRDRRGVRLDGDARAVLARLSSAGPTASIDGIGDSQMLPSQLRADRSEIARMFGDDFANSVVGMDPGTWVGPVKSTYGLHVVYVSEREPGRQLTLAEARAQVEREFTLERRREQLAAVYDKLLDQYRIVMERRPETPPADGAQREASR